MPDLRSRDVRWRVARIDRSREDRGIVVVTMESTRHRTRIRMHLLLPESAERIRRLEYARSAGTLLPTEDL